MTLPRVATGILLPEWLFLDMLEKKIRDKKEVITQKIRQDAAQHLWRECAKNKVYTTTKGVVYVQPSRNFRILESLEPLKQIPQALQHLKTTVSFDGSKMTQPERVKLQEFIKSSFATH